jgi:hypothetical protein
MKTPYGEIPERLVKDMSAQDMHDYLRKRYSRRGVLKSAAAMGAIAAAGPQSGSTITSISDEAVMDNVTLVRNSVTGPAGHSRPRHPR